MTLNKVLLCNYASVFGGQEIFLKSFHDLLNVYLPDCDIIFDGSPVKLQIVEKCEGDNDNEVFDVIFLNGISAARKRLIDLLNLRRSNCYYIHHSDLLDRQAGYLRIIPRLLFIFLVCLLSKKVFYISDRNRWFFRLFLKSSLVPLNFFPCFLTKEKEHSSCVTEANEVKLLYVGSLTENKRWRTCIDIARQSQMNIKLFGEIHHDFGNFGNNVTFEGFCNDHTQIYQPGSVLLCLSMYEGLPLVVLEALKAGIPVICTDVGDIKRIVKHGQNGFIIRNQKNTSKIVDEVTRYLNLLKEDLGLYISLSKSAYRSVDSINPPTREEFLQFLFGPDQ